MLFTLRGRWGLTIGLAGAIGTVMCSPARRGPPSVLTPSPQLVGLRQQRRDFGARRESELQISNDTTVPITVSAW